MNAFWYRGWHWLCTRIYFDRIAILNPERLPSRGPTLYVGLHRNGAVDGFVYHQATPGAVFLISTQLVRSFFARLFFHGIAVARLKDEEDRTHNLDALRQCQELLAAGGSLFVFPEGTSSLGPRHLPFKSGAVQIALDYLATGSPLQIVPLGIHYHRAWAFRSQVEVVPGNPIRTDLEPGLSQLGRLKELKRRVNAGLEAVGTNFNSAEELQRAELLAYLATLETGRPYFDALKAMEPGLPGNVLARWQEFETILSSRRPALHQGAPLFPDIPLPLALLFLILLGPIVLTGALANLPPLLAGWFAGKKFADGRNVIALWRILVGLPVFLLWFCLAALVLAIYAGGIAALAYAGLTFLALQLWTPARKLAVGVSNAIGHRALRAPLQALREALRTDLPSR